VILAGLVAIDPVVRVMMPPVDIVMPAALENVPVTKLRFVIVTLDVVGNVAPDRLRVSVPRPEPEKPTSVGNVPEPLTMTVDEFVVKRSPPGTAGP